MKIPHKIKIGGRTIKVITKKIDTLGLSDYERGIIWLKTGMTRESKEATFIHEIFHMMNTTMGHKTLDSLAEQWYGVLTDNDLLK